MKEARSNVVQMAADIVEAYTHVGKDAEARKTRHFLGRDAYDAHEAAALEAKERFEALDARGEATSTAAFVVTANGDTAVQVDSEKLQCLEQVIRRYTLFLSALQDSDTRDRFVQSKGAEELPRAQRRAVGGVLRAGVESLCLTNALAREGEAVAQLHGADELADMWATWALSQSFHTNALVLGAVSNDS